MSTAIQRRRGTTSQHATFTGLAGETTVDTDKNTVVVHNGSTAGGFPLLRENFSNAPDGVVTTAKLANDSVTTAKLADGSVTTAKWAAANGQLAGFRNKIINGAMAIDQRNAGSVQTFTAGAALAYCVDRFYGYCTGANVTGQRVAGTAPNQFNYQFTGAASVTKIGFSQRIEAANSQDLAGTTATLSVDLANSLLTTVTWTAWRANTNDAFGTLASPTRTQIGTGTFTVTGTLARYSAQISVPAAATTGIEIELSVGAQTSGTWTIGRLKLEPGAFATAYDYTPIGAELALCQRYYETQFASTFVSYTSGGVNKILSGVWSSRKRATPTVSFANAITVNTASAVGVTAWTAGNSGGGGANVQVEADIIGSAEL